MFRWVVGAAIALALVALLFGIGIGGLERQYEQPSVRPLVARPTTVAVTHQAPAASAARGLRPTLPTSVPPGAKSLVTVASERSSSSTPASIPLSVSAGEPFSGPSPLTTGIRVPSCNRVTSAAWELNAYPPYPLRMSTRSPRHGIAYKPGGAPVSADQLRDISQARAKALCLDGHGTMYAHKRTLYPYCRPAPGGRHVRRSAK